MSLFVNSSLLGIKNWAISWHEMPDSLYEYLVSLYMNYSCPSIEYPIFIHELAPWIWTPNFWITHFLVWINHVVVQLKPFHLSNSCPCIYEWFSSLYEKLISLISPYLKYNSCPCMFFHQWDLCKKIKSDLGVKKNNPATSGSVLEVGAEIWQLLQDAGMYVCIYIINLK